MQEVPKSHVPTHSCLVDICSCMLSICTIRYDLQVWPILVPRLSNFFLYSTQFSTKFIPHINVRMPTIVGIFTFKSMINTSERLRARHSFHCRYFSFYEKLKFRAQLS